MLNCTNTTVLGPLEAAPHHRLDLAFGLFIALRKPRAKNHGIGIWKRNNLSLALHGRHFSSWETVISFLLSVWLGVKLVSYLFFFGLFRVAVSCAVLNLQLSLLFLTNFVHLNRQYEQEPLKNLPVFCPQHTRLDSSFYDQNIAVRVTDDFFGNASQKY